MSAHARNMESCVTTLTFRQRKGKEKLAMVTAYDFPAAAMADAAGMDAILVGDSLGMVELGRNDTVSVTLEEMIHHTRAVVAAVRRALVVMDMPFMTCERSVDYALENAARSVQESGARAVKVEGGREIAPQVSALVRAGIPVMGHIGLTPQRAAVFGGFKVQGKTASAAALLLEDALALEAAGCFSITLEAVPAPVAAIITKKLSIPTIGIGAGPDCDGQVLVFHDLLGLTQGHVPRFVKQYANLAEAGTRGLAAYVNEVRQGTFPAQEHSFSMPEGERSVLAELEKK